MSEESRMKKTIIRIAVCVVVFLASALIIGSIMNQGHNNMTMEMAPATLPMITMESGGVACNELHGNTVEMDVAYQKDCITLLGEGRQANFTVDTFGREITEISTEVRSIDGSRLIENSEVTGWKANGKSFSVSLTLKDLIDTNTQYSLTLILELEGEQKVYYYTTILWNDDVHISEILEFATDFHGKLYDKEVAKELTKYLEPNSKLTDNGTFHKVNIHSSFQQITWGSLEPVQEDAASIRLTQISGNVASLLMDFVVSTGEGKNKIYYNVEEYYRVRYTSERMYLLDYERTMTQIPDTTRMYANDKILLGITDENVDMMESADGNTVVFSDMGQLLSYNAATNGLTVIFSFYDKDNADRRTLYDNHGIKILDVDEGGNVKFAVYGYMNRGRHEGETGIQIISYDNSLNTIEEEVYIPYSKSYAVLKDEMEQLLYRNRQQHVYFFLENGVYDVDLENRSAEQLVSIRQDDSLQVSENHEIIVWQEGDDINHSNQLNVRNLNTGEQTVIRAEDGEAIRPLGFMGEDIIYGVARESDIRTENSGQIFYPMYKVCISNSSGDNLKEYGQDGIYIVDCAIEGNQITLSRIQRSENGSYQEILDDQIMNNVEEEPGQNKVVTADIDIYERYVQIQTKTTIDTKTIKVLNPKEVVFEGGRELTLDAVSEVSRYYVYNAYGVQGIYSAPGKAVKEAYDSAGVVANDRGITVWLKGNRSAGPGRLWCQQEPDHGNQGRKCHGPEEQPDGMSGQYPAACRNHPQHRI